MSCNLHHLSSDGAPAMTCLPGWATDWRIFQDLSGDYDICSPDNFLPPAYHDTIIRHLRSHTTSPVDLCGWSLGAYAALEIARTIPEKVRRLILVGVRPHYSRKEIQAIRMAVRRDRRRCLKRFYRECFLPAQKADYKHFRKKRLESYLDDMSRETLLAGLDYLEQQSLPPDELPECDIMIVHGKDDVVAPVEPTRQLADRMTGVSLHILSSTGHAAFTSPQFPHTLNNDQDRHPERAHH